MKIEIDEEWLKKAKQLVDSYAHVYSFVGDDSMPRAREELFKHLSFSVSDPHVELKAKYTHDVEACNELCSLDSYDLWQYCFDNVFNKCTTEPQWNPDTEYRRHPHADSIIEYHKCSNTDKKRWQEKCFGGSWVDCLCPDWINYQYRIKPRTITINGNEYNAPMNVAPEIGSQYFVMLQDGYSFNVCQYTWANLSNDFSALNNYRAFVSKEDCHAVCDAFNSILESAE